MPRLILYKMQKKGNASKTIPVEKAQGALEYLLLIGGAILVAVIVIALILNIGGSSEEETYLATAHALCAKFPQNECRAQAVSVKGRSFLCLPIVAGQCRAAKGLIGFWKMNENVAGPGQQILDISGKGNTGTLYSTTNCTLATRPNGGNECSFNATTDGIEVENESNFDFEKNNSFSIAAWVKRSSNLQDRAIVSKGISSSSMPQYVGYIFGLDKYADATARIRLAMVGNPSGNLYVESNNGIADNTWHHVAVTYNGSGDTSGVRLYIGGADDTSSSNQTNSLGSNSILTDFKLKIGDSRDQIANGDHWDGSIDEVTVWNRVLSDAEIQALAKN